MDKNSAILSSIFLTARDETKAHLPPPVLLSSSKTTSQCFCLEQPRDATSAALWRDVQAERTGTIPNPHTAFPGSITPGRRLYITRTGLWLPVFNYYYPSGPRHVCHLKQISACSSSLLCFKTCKKASALPAGLKMKMSDSSPNSQSGAPAAGSNGLLPPWKLESEYQISPNALLTCYMQSTPLTLQLCLSPSASGLFFFLFALEVSSAEKSPTRTTSHLDYSCSCQSQCNSRNTRQKVQHYGANPARCLRQECRHQLINGKVLKDFTR